MHVKEQILTKSRHVERMKEGWNEMMKYINHDLVMLLREKIHLS